MFKLYLALLAEPWSMQDRRTLSYHFLFLKITTQAARLGNGCEHPSRRYREERRIEWRMKTLTFWVVMPCNGIQAL
jgi:hypothetical protein